MPIYVYECGKCHVKFDVYKRIAELDAPVHCSCGAEARRLIVAPMVAPDYPGYISPASGKWIEGRRAHIEDLKRTGCRIYEPGETEEFIKNMEKRKRENVMRGVEAAVTAAARDLRIA